MIEKFKKIILKLPFIDKLKELSNHKGLNFESLNGNDKGFYTVRVDKSYSLILTVDRSGALYGNEVIEVHDLNNHYQ